MSLRRGLYRSVKTCEVGVALTKREKAWTPKRLAAKAERVTWEASLTQRGICSGLVDTR
jgi:hypothetical protein